MLQYYHLSEEALGPYGYSWKEGSYTEVTLLHMEVLQFNSSSIHPASKTAHFSDNAHWGKSCLKQIVYVSLVWTEGR